MPFQPGNKLGGGRKDKPFRDALMMELKAAGKDMPELRKIARGLIQRAIASDQAAKEVADRLDGKVPQAVVGDDDHPPVQTEQTIIERLIIEHAIADSDRPSVPPATRAN